MTAPHGLPFPILDDAARDRWPVVADELASLPAATCPLTHSVTVQRREGEETELALQYGRFALVGSNVVRASGNDLLARGALARRVAVDVRLGQIDDEAVEALLLGIVRACSAQGVALDALRVASISGAGPRGLEVAATMHGEQVMTPRSAGPGHEVVALLAHGLHSRGHARARALLAAAGLREDSLLPSMAEDQGTAPRADTVLDALLAGHKSYASSLHRLLLDGVPTALAHVDAGGLDGAARSLLADGTTLDLDGGAWPLPPLLAALPRDHTIWNGGVGFLLAIPADRADAALRHIAAWNEPHHRMGRSRA